jgi:hypothetical protein
MQLHVSDLILLSIISTKTFLPENCIRTFFFLQQVAQVSKVIVSRS